MHTLRVKLFKALADETRIDIIRYLSQTSEISCQTLMKKFSLSQPTLSHHFSKLVNADVVCVRKSGLETFYSLNRDFLKKTGINIEKVVVH